MSIQTPRKRTSYQSARAGKRHLRVLGTRTRLRITDNGIFALGMLVGIALTLSLAMAYVVASDTPDPWNGVPWCTHEIADAGGICHGNPR